MIFTLLLSFTVVLAGCNSDEASSDGDQETKNILKKVKDEGKLMAGINGDLPGFGYLEGDTYKGFDVDFAKAIAAAVLGDAEKIEFRPLSAQERFTAVSSGEVDVLVRNSTWTTNRDAEIGMNFAPVNFYDGQGIMVRNDSGINKIEDLEGKRIAVEQGTTTEQNLVDVMRTYGIEFESVVYDGVDAAVAAYETGSVDAWTTDKSGLVSRKSIMEDPDAHKVLEETLSKEPLAPAVAHGDDQWFDIVKWVVFATIQAEEYGITSENVDEYLEDDNPEIQRLLGKEGNLGEQLGLPEDFAYQVIKQVGNYGEIFERNLGEDTIFGLDRGMNALYTDGGLMYSPPFR
ncbi:amino acid ABC transporter substrate-binding protein [Bacillus carboniphilus]|uniref:Amino acid ABC transporter substrate-binding protein n=1 Tax=Bacillus carboniphilus TaxID=86663 RepID=A0ABY9JSL0_9BACI|nr:amino acid ABC transporter substrate-binding protein [Bacillus carboniphilus]WLR41372.1 amino acid ABC transporter substrate-binding protein [Bacillus carboniphilus]